jgi:hypothetical protein
MAGWGVNVVRLAVAWNYLEPAPGVFDRGHLHAQIDAVVQTSAGDAWQFDATRSRLVIRRDPSRAEHTVQIRPAS